MADEQKIEGIEIEESSVTKSEAFIEKNQKMLSIILLIVIVIVGGYLGYQKFYAAPMETEAMEQIFAAEQYFEKDSFNLALNGDGNYLGFVDIIDEYGSTKVGNLANYYAGICCLRLGQFEDAIDYLKSFTSDDQMIAPMAYAATGDAYAELGDLDQAAEYYLKSAYASTNEFTAPAILMKAGMVYEELGKYEDALAVYEKIKTEYSKSTEGNATRIDKFIDAAKFKAGL